MDSNNDNQDVKNMTDTQLLEAYKTGSGWVSRRMQVTGTNKNELGEIYNHTEFMRGLKRLEALEDEMNKRGLAYG